MYLHTHSSHVGIIQQKYIFPPNPWRSQLDISSFWTYCVQEYDRFVFSWFFNGEFEIRQKYSWLETLQWNKNILYSLYLLLHVFLFDHSGDRNVLFECFSMRTCDQNMFSSCNHVGYCGGHVNNILWKAETSLVYSPILRPSSIHVFLLQQAGCVNFKSLYTCTTSKSHSCDI